MIRRQVTLPAGPARVWTELTDPDAASQWFGAQVDWELVPGATARFVEDGATRRGQIDQVLPGRRLRFRWWPEDRGDTEASEVTYELAPDGEGTTLTVTERRVAAPSLDDQHGPVDSATAWSAWDARIIGVWARAAAHAGVTV
jgi:uncharacterized protein YndB with AHSA1/START domain